MSFYKTVFNFIVLLSIFALQIASSPIASSTVVGPASTSCELMFSKLESTNRSQLQTISLSKNKDHFQHIQKLRDSGNIAEAQEYESKLSSILKSGEFSEKGRLGRSGGNKEGARLVKFSEEVEGVWKAMEVYEGLGGHGEIIAFKVDQHLGLNRVPLTVERELNGKKGTVQLVVDHTEDGKVNDPFQLNMFDYLIANPDRRDINYLVTKDGRLVAIDNGGAGLPEYIDETSAINFPKIFDSKLKIIYEDKQRKLDVLKTTNPDYEDLRNLAGSKKAYIKLKETSDSQWRSMLSPHMNETQIVDFLNRKKNIVDAVEKARQQMGDIIFLP